MQDPAFHEYINHKNNTCPYFELANKNWELPAPHSEQLQVWYNKAFQRNVIKGALPASLRPITPSMRVGFIANELLDPAGCNGGTLDKCRSKGNGSCAGMWPMNYLVHQCLNTWRGRIGD